ncbi:hypothetical protein ACH5RR_039009 [Cinchona calisaya]|uniref:Uncharacterized protein n=1 Tax=Cinchona calisaya TaxID=153742 RepID=A0ABD2XZG5_9GENT
MRLSFRKASPFSSSKLTSSGPILFHSRHYTPHLFARNGIRHVSEDYVTFSEALFFYGRRGNKKGRMDSIAEVNHGPYLLEIYWRPYVLETIGGEDVIGRVVGLG